MNYLDRFEQKTQNQPSFLALSADNQKHPGQKYFMVGFAILFASVWFDVPGKLKKVRSR